MSLKHRYQIFGIQAYYPNGGAADWLGGIEEHTPAEVLRLVNMADRPMDTAHVWDLSEGDVAEYVLTEVSDWDKEKKFRHEIVSRSDAVCITKFKGMDWG